MKTLFTTLVALCFVVTTFTAQRGTGIAVQVAALEQPIAMSNFNGLSGIYQSRDHNNIYRYYVGGYATSSDAQPMLQKALERGFPYARIVDLDDIRAKCALSCAGSSSSSVQPDQLRSIFFDFDQSFLRPNSKFELDKLYTILVNNPSYSAELRAHTDARGTNSYNDALSQRRANAAKHYLVSKGISSSRLNARTYGENTPIAKNEKNGTDTPEGRQLNRRVELLVIDGSGNYLNHIVEPIHVPAELKVGN